MIDGNGKKDLLMDGEIDENDMQLYEKQAEFDHHIDSLYAAISERNNLQHNDNGRYSPVSTDDDNMSLMSVPPTTSQTNANLPHTLETRSNREELEKRNDQEDRDDADTKVI